MKVYMAMTCSMEIDEELFGCEGFNPFEAMASGTIKVDDLVISIKDEDGNDILDREEIESDEFVESIEEIIEDIRA